MKTTKTKAMLVKEKQLLEKQLKQIQDLEKKDAESKFQELLDKVKPELDTYRKLSSFVKKGKVKVEISYDIDFSICGHDLDFPPLTSMGEIDAVCYATVKEPKGHNITPFVFEDNFTNLGYDGYDELVAVDPDLKNHCRKLVKAREKLIAKIAKTAQRLGMDEGETLYRVQESMYD